MKRAATILITALRLTLRDFFTVFFALVFPSLMLLLFGSIFGRYRGPAGGTMLDEITPAYTCIVMGVTGVLGFPLTFAGNLEHGVYRRFDVTPVGRLPVIWGELTANALLTFAGLGILLAFARIAFGTVPQGSWLGLLGAAMLSIAALFAVGFFLVAAAPGARSALALCYTAYFVMLFLSGATLPQMLLGSTLTTVSDWLPMTYAVRLMQAAFMGTAAGVIQDVLALTMTSLAGVLLGALIMRRRPV